MVYNKFYRVMYKTTLSWLIIVLLLNSIMLHSQNAHYWTEQYGNKSMLLSGSVIGGVEDLGAIYYNPARLAQIEHKIFLLSANLYEYATIQTENSNGQTNKKTQSNLNALPGIAAGRFSLPFLKAHTFEWAILSRQNADLSFSLKTESSHDISTNEEIKFSGSDLALTNKTKDQWIGFAWSYPINKNLSIGISNFISILDQTKGNYINLYTLTNDNQLAFYRENKNVTYQHYSFLQKIGIAYQNHRFSAGLTFKTPKINIKGSGSYRNEIIFANAVDSNSVTNQLTSTSQSGLQTRNRSPWAIGAGVTYSLGKSKIHFSTEYYSKVNKYILLQANSYQSQSSDKTYQFELIDKINSVMNMGIGLEMQISDEFSVYISSNSDISAVTSNMNSFIEDETTTSNSIVNADNYHFAGGFALKIKRSEITLGASYTGNNQSIPYYFNFPNNNEKIIVSPNQNAKLTWQRWRFLFSFSIPFLKEMQKKVERRFNL